MQKFILIQNDGEIDLKSIELIGASTKRGSGKIGFFGSGLKYSIAYMLRKGICFRIFSGDNEILVTTEKESFRDQSFDRICVNGVKTSFTTSMGPTWTKDWFVIREIYCNALDEGGCMIVKETDNVNPSSGKTRIYIEITQDIDWMLNCWNEYFTEDRTPKFVTNNVYTSYLCDSPNFFQPITVYSKTAGSIFRKGIKVYEDKNLLYDYEAEFININEDRQATNPTGLMYGICGAVASFCNKDFVQNVLRNTESKEYDSLGECQSSDHQFSEKWIKFSEDNLLVLHEISGKYTEEIRSANKPVYLIPARMANRLVSFHPDVKILGLSSTGRVNYKLLAQTEKMKYLLKDVCNILAEIGYELKTQSIKVVDFESNHALSDNDDSILLSEKLFDRGRRLIALNIILQDQLINGSKDCGFEEQLINCWLSTMELNSSLFL